MRFCLWVRDFIFLFCFLSYYKKGLKLVDKEKREEEKKKSVGKMITGVGRGGGGLHA